MVMLVLAAGFFWGGWIADRKPTDPVHIADARPWLAEHAVNSDLVHIDLFQADLMRRFISRPWNFFSRCDRGWRIADRKRVR